MSTASVSPSQPVDSGFVDVVRKTLERSERPLSASALSKQLTGPFRISAKKLEQRLDEMAERGEVFVLSKFRGAKQYWTRDLESFAREEMLRQLSEGPLTRSELKSKLKVKLNEVSPARQDAIFKSLLEQGEVQKLPRYIGARSDRFSTRGADPRDYIVHALEKVRQTLSKAGISRAQVDAAACAIVEQWNHQPVDAEETVSAVATIPEPSESLDLPRAILSRMEEIEPRAREGAMVYIPELRRAAEFLHRDRAEFDRAIWDLVRVGRIAVHRYDHAATLTEAERADLLRDESGQFYNGLSLRISS